MSISASEAAFLGLDTDDPELHFDPIERQRVTEERAADAGWLRERQTEIVRGRKVAFQRIFRDGMASKDDVTIVMQVLNRFCRWRETCFHPDPRLHAVAEGRREVRLLVEDYIELSVDELINKLA